MKALSIRQPWLYCITDLDKRVENRTWKPPDWIVGQRISLHASKKMDDMAGRRAASNLAGFKLSTVADDMPLGAIVATAVVRGWVNENGVSSQPSLNRYVDDKWFFGPIGWILDDIRKIQPVYCRGALGLWEVTK